VTGNGRASGMLHHHPQYLESEQAARLFPTGRPGELERLLRASALRGEPWSSVLQRFTARIRSVARAHRLSAHDAEDVVQTTWLRLLEHLDRVREPEAVGAWLQTTARRESLRVLREGARTQPVEEERLETHEEAAGAGEVVELLERVTLLGQAIQALPRRQRDLMLTLLAEPEPSYADVARRLDMPIGSIGPTRARSLERLRRDVRIAALAETEA
jgi:RNA polymerase sigma factor (sigma-70 family)